MKPVQLELINFGAYRHAIVNFESLEADPLFLIGGNTGAGKSTLFDGMTMALFDTGCGERKSDEMRSTFATIEDPLTQMTFYFRHGEHLYRVKRTIQQERKTLRGNRTTIHKPTAHLAIVDAINGTEITSIATLHKEVSHEISELLGFNADQFKQVILLPQNEFRKFLNAESGDKLETLKNIFGITLFEKFSRNLSERHSEAKKEFEQLAAQLDAQFESEIWSFEEKEQLLLGNIQDKAARVAKIIQEHELKYLATDNLYKNAQSRLVDANKALEEGSIISTYFDHLEKAQKRYKTEITEQQAQFANWLHTKDRLIFANDLKEHISKLDEITLREIEIKNDQKEKENALSDKQILWDQAILKYTKLEHSRPEIEKLVQEKEEWRLLKEQAKIKNTLVIDQKQAQMKVKLIKKEQTSLKEEIEVLQNSLRKLKMEEIPPLEMASHTNRVKEFKRIISVEFAKLDKEKEQLEQQIKSDKKDREEKEQTLKQEHQKVTDLQSNVEKSIKNRQNIVRKQNDSEEQLAVLENEKTAESELSKQQHKIVDFERIAKVELFKMTKEEEELSDQLEKEIDIKNDRKRQLEISQDSLSESIKNLESSKKDRRMLMVAQLRSELKSGHACDVCGATEHPFVCESIETVIANPKALKKIMEEVEKLQAEVAKLEASIVKEKERLLENDEKIKKLTNLLQCKTKAREDYYRQLMCNFSDIELPAVYDQEALNQVCKTLNDQFDKLSNKNQSIIENIITLTTKIKGLDDDLRSTDIELTKLETQVTASKVRIEDIEKNVFASDKSIDQLEEKLLTKNSDQQTNYKNLVEEFSSLVKKFPDNYDPVYLQRVVNDWKVKLKEKNKQNEKIREEIAMLEVDQEQLNDKMKVCELGLKEKETELKMTCQSLEKLEREYPDLKTYSVYESKIAMVDKRVEDFESNLDRFAQIEKTTKEAIAELTGQTSEIQKQLANLKEEGIRLRNHLSCSLANERALITQESELRLYLERLDELEVLQQEISNHLALKNQLEIDIQNLELKISNFKKPDMDNLNEKQISSQEVLTVATQNKVRAKTRLDQAKGVHGKIIQLMDVQKDSLVKYRELSDLHQVMNADRGSKINLETYVIQVYLEKVLDYANSHYLNLLTGGRYQLSLSENVRDGRKASGLNIDVYDLITGNTRSTKTLSGGETFICALAIALSLSEVVKNEANGTAIEALFIDEGFGSLDQEMLASAMEALEKIGENRMVGVISHVTEMKDRIAQQLIIKKMGDGSSVVEMLSLV